MSNETKLRYRNKELTNALVQSDQLLQQMLWRIERVDGDGLRLRGQCNPS